MMKFKCIEYVTLTMELSLQNESEKKEDETPAEGGEEVSAVVRRNCEKCHLNKVHAFIHLHVR